MNDGVNVYKGLYYKRSEPLRSPLSPCEKYNKTIVFDVDETFGYFYDLKILWNYLITRHCRYNTQKNFNQLLDLFPEFLRYGILPILNYVYNKKNTSECFKIYVYTNNKYEKEWVNHILDYLSYKLNCQTQQLFDQVIYAFKLNNKIIEPRRTTNSKTFGDFINCTMLPISTEICFIDNKYFPEMKNERVYYIQPFSYYHDLLIDEVVHRLVNSELWLNNMDIYHDGNDDIECVNDIHRFFQRASGGVNTQKIRKLNFDMQVSKKIMYHIKEFFYFPNDKRKTRKNNMMLKRMTRKKYVNVL